MYIFILDFPTLLGKDEEPSCFCFIPKHQMSILGSSLILIPVTTVTNQDTVVPRKIFSHILSPIYQPRFTGIIQTKNVKYHGVYLLFIAI